MLCKLHKPHRIMAEQDREPAEQAKKALTGPRAAAAGDTFPGCRGFEHMFDGAGLAL